MEKTIYQAGYYSGNTWEACGYGETIEQAREDLQKRIRLLAERDFARDIEHAKSFLCITCRYKEQSFKERY